MQSSLSTDWDCVADLQLSSAQLYLYAASSPAQLRPLLVYGHYALMRSTNLYGYSLTSIMR
eukprot:2582442-Pleurochrysis_carterae.AAC.1